jgi:phosphatidylserine/phosphatidylglycerophosphate/cardiolipin synthase-like enzyme
MVYKLTSLSLLALAAIAMAILLRDGLRRQRYAEHQRIQIKIDALQNELRDKIKEVDNLERSMASLLKFKNRAAELEEELKAIKVTQSYASAKRQEYLQNFINVSRKNPNAIFLTTFPPAGMYSFKDKLNQMMEEAHFEIIIVSPWIKKQMWEMIKIHFAKFIRQGGTLKVFMRGCESDYSLGLSDNLSKEIKDLGGEVILLKQLHAKFYVVDKKEAIIVSSNLTKGGVEENYEAGIWLDDPIVLEDICSFIDKLYRLRLS